MSITERRAERERTGHPKRSVHQKHLTRAMSPMEPSGVISV